MFLFRQFRHDKFSTRKILPFFLLSGYLLAGCELPGAPILLPTLTQREVYLTAGITPPVTATAPPQTPTATIQPEIVLGAGYNQVYLLPEIGFPIRDAIRRGEAFEVVGRNQTADWVQIRYRNSEMAWIPTQSLTLIGQINLDALPEVNPYPPVPVPLEDWKGEPVQNLCLMEDIRFDGTFASENPEKTPEAGLSPQVISILHAMGIQTPPQLDLCDATLTIQTNVEPRGKSFSEAVTGNKRMCYTGVQIKSKWELVQGDRKKSFALTEERGTQDHPLYCAPISEYQTELTALMYTGLNKLWGGGVLPGMLQVDDPTVNELAIQLAGAGGRRSLPAIPELIKYLDHPDLGYKAYRALKTITGRGFIKEAYLWQQWWDEQLVLTSTP